MFSDTSEDEQAAGQSGDQPKDRAWLARQALQRRRAQRLQTVPQARVDGKDGTWTGQSACRRLLYGPPVGSVQATAQSLNVTREYLTRLTVVLASLTLQAEHDMFNSLLSHVLEQHQAGRLRLVKFVWSPMYDETPARARSSCIVPETGALVDSVGINKIMACQISWSFLVQTDGGTWVRVRGSLGTKLASLSSQDRHVVLES